ncbi:MAG: DUF1801 domain-containing protein [Prolixibacteraceae bacterium]
MIEITPPNVDLYIAGFPAETQEILNQLRETIRKVAPEAEEMISYQMPAYKYHGMLAYFAGYKNHIGFYPTGSGIESFKHKLSVFKTSKGTVKFPIDQPLPLELITEIVQFRVAENLEKMQAKRKKKA